MQRFTAQLFTTLSRRAYSLQPGRSAGSQPMGNPTTFPPEKMDTIDTSKWGEKDKMSKKDEEKYQGIPLEGSPNSVNPASENSQPGWTQDERRRWQDDGGKVGGNQRFGPNGTRRPQGSVSEMSPGSNDLQSEGVSEKSKTGSQKSRQEYEKSGSSQSFTRSSLSQDSSNQVRDQTKGESMEFWKNDDNTESFKANENKSTKTWDTTTGKPLFDSDYAQLGNKSGSKNFSQSKSGKKDFDRDNKYSADKDYMSTGSQTGSKEMDKNRKAANLLRDEKKSGDSEGSYDGSSTSKKINEDWTQRQSMGDRDSNTYGQFGSSSVTKMGQKEGKDYAYSQEKMADRDAPRPTMDKAEGKTSVADKSMKTGSSFRP